MPNRLRERPGSTSEERREKIERSGSRLVHNAELALEEVKGLKPKCDLSALRARKAKLSALVDALQSDMLSLSSAAAKGRQESAEILKLKKLNAQILEASSDVEFVRAYRAMSDAENEFDLLCSLESLRNVPDEIVRLAIETKLTYEPIRKALAAIKYPIATLETRDEELFEEIESQLDLLLRRDALSSFENDCVYDVFVEPVVLRYAHHFGSGGKLGRSTDMTDTASYVMELSKSAMSVLLNLKSKVDVAENFVAGVVKDVVHSRLLSMSMTLEQMELAFEVCADLDSFFKTQFGVHSSSSCVEAFYSETLDGGRLRQAFLKSLSEDVKAQVESSAVAVCELFAKVFKRYVSVVTDEAQVLFVAEVLQEVSILKEFRTKKCKLLKGGYALDEWLSKACDLVYVKRYVEYVCESEPAYLKASAWFESKIKTSKFRPGLVFARELKEYENEVRVGIVRTAKSIVREFEDHVLRVYVPEFDDESKEVSRTLVAPLSRLQKHLGVVEAFENLELSVKNPLLTQIASGVEDVLLNFDAPIPAKDLRVGAHELFRPFCENPINRFFRKSKEVLFILNDSNHRSACERAVDDDSLLSSILESLLGRPTKNSLETWRTRLKT